MAKTPEEWANELIEAWQDGTDLKDQVADYLWKDLKQKAIASFMLAQDQAFKRGYVTK